MSPVSNWNGTMGFEPTARFYSSCSSHRLLFQVPFVLGFGTDQIIRRAITPGKRERFKEFHLWLTSSTPVYIVAYLRRKKRKKRKNFLFFQKRFVFFSGRFSGYISSQFHCHLLPGHILEYSVFYDSLHPKRNCIHPGFHL